MRGSGTVHVAGNRVEPEVLVVAALGLLAAAGVLVVLRARGVPWGRAAAWAALVVVSSVIAAVSFVPDSGRDGQGTCSFLVTFRVGGRVNQPLLNVLMYVPLGALVVMLPRRMVTRSWSVAALLVVPLVVEWIQRFPIVGRSCDADDVIGNWLGIVIGVLIGAICIAVARRGSSSSMSQRSRQS